MGCDIHLHFERKNKEGIWDKLEIPADLMPDDRNYDVFGFLADVRACSDNPQFSHRGMPKDTTAVAEQLGEHSYTYAYLDEILQAPWEEMQLTNCYFFVFCVYVLPRLHGVYGTLLEEEHRNIRVVMGFDS